MKNSMKMERIHKFKQFYVKIFYFENKNNIISINLNQSNNYQSYSLKTNIQLV